MAALAVVIALLRLAGYRVRRTETDVLPAEERGAGAAIQRAWLPVGNAGFRRTGSAIFPIAVGWRGVMLADGGIADPLHYRATLAPEPTDALSLPEIAGTGRRRAQHAFLWPLQ